MSANLLPGRRPLQRKINNHRRGRGFSLPRPAVGDVDAVQLPFAHGLRNGNLECRSLLGINEMRGKETPRLEKMRLPRDVLIDLNWLSGHAQFLELRHDVLLLRRRVVQLRLRAQMVGEKRGVMIYGEPLNHLPAEGPRFTIHCLFVIEEPPGPASDYREQNNHNDESLARRVRSTIKFRVFHLIAQSQTFDYFAVTNQRAVVLHASVSAESIARIDFKVNDVAVEVLVLRP